MPRGRGIHPKLELVNHLPSLLLMMTTASAKGMGHIQQHAASCSHQRDGSGCITKEQALSAVPALMIVAAAAPLLLGEATPAAIAQQRADAAWQQARAQRQEVVKRVVGRAFTQLDQTSSNKLQGEQRQWHADCGSWQ